jgi:hypothetical protein
MSITVRSRRKSNAPPVQSKKPRVYLAGKISKQDWRQEIVNLRDLVEPDDALNPDFELECDRFILTGPFFISCDHGCSHGPHTHGAGPGCGYDPDDKLLGRQGRVHALSLLRVRRADMIFAYLNAADCYGTCFEIGFAAALGKPI